MSGKKEKLKRKQLGIDLKQKRAAANEDRELALQKYQAEQAEKREANEGKGGVAATVAVAATLT